MRRRRRRRHRTAGWAGARRQGAARRGRAICRCDSQSFCNFDGGDSSFWSCEQCSSFESVEKCSTDGLPEAGEKDCKACCFGDSGEYAPTYKPTVEPQPTYRPTTQRR